MVYNALFHSTFIFWLFLAEFIKLAENLHYVGIPSTSWPHYVVRSSEKRYCSPQILLVYANCMCLRSISGAKKRRVALYVSASRLLPWNQTLSGLTPMRVGPEYQKYMSRGTSHQRLLLHWWEEAMHTTKPRRVNRKVYKTSKDKTSAASSQVHTCAHGERL